VTPRHPASAAGPAINAIPTAFAVPEDISEADRRVRIPYYPVHSEVRLLLPVWSGKARSQITHMHSGLAGLQGSQQDPADWTSPDEWISTRLQGPDREMAAAIWTGTNRQVNPRRVYGHWLLATNYGLLDEAADGRMNLTERGRAFVDNAGGADEALIDEGEGLLKLLSLVGELGPARPRDLLVGWSDYLKRRSRFGSDSMINDSLQRRLRNLVERHLIARSAAQYSITDAGLEYLHRFGSGGDVPANDRELHQLLALSKLHRTSVCGSVRRMFTTMDPIAFEHLIRRLLEAMDYQNVRVTDAANDKGVDVVADIELGITSVREVVQAKRHAQPIQRKELDALRGSLHRFKAVRGTLITTGTFSRGTRDAAFETGVAPITLIDGDKLVDLLVEYEVGVRKKTIELLELDRNAFADCENDARNSAAN
jgi:restriction system protein